MVLPASQTLGDVIREWKQAWFGQILAVSESDAFGTYTHSSLEDASGDMYGQAGDSIYDAQVWVWCGILLSQTQRERERERGEQEQVAGCGAGLVEVDLPP